MKHELYDRLYEQTETKSTLTINRTQLVQTIDSLPIKLKDPVRIKNVNEWIQSLIIKHYMDHGSGNTATPYGCKCLANGGVRYTINNIPPRLLLILNEFIEEITL